MLRAAGSLGHLAPPLVPGELWSAWSLDPMAWSVLLGALVVHTRGWRATSVVQRARDRWRRRAFLAAIATATVALISPLDALSASLASAHMVQHLLLTVVVAPLVVLGAPTAVLLRGLPRGLRVDLRRVQRAVRLRPARVVSAHPIVVAVIATATLWGWHAAGPYELALRNDLVHRVEHACFLATAVAAWAAILRAGHHREPSIGMALMVAFGLSVQGSVLGALLTFAPAPWYGSYVGRTGAWGLSALEDQQLAGVIMWVPGGIGYLAAALAGTARWITADRVEGAAPVPMAQRW